MKSYQTFNKSELNRNLPETLREFLSIKYLKLLENQTETDTSYLPYVTTLSFLLTQIILIIRVRAFPRPDSDLLSLWEIISYRMEISHWG